MMRGCCWFGSMFQHVPNNLTLLSSWRSEAFFSLLQTEIIFQCVRESAVSPSSALWPRSSGRKRRSTAHTSRFSGREGDFTPTNMKPGGTSKGSEASEDRRRSLPAWQKPVSGDGQWKDKSIFIKRVTFIDETNIHFSAAPSMKFLVTGT